MATKQPTSENKSIKFCPDSLVMPCLAATVINQGSRVLNTAGVIAPTAACTDAFCGVADFQNPVASLNDQLTSGKVLLKDNVVYFDAPVAEAFVFGADVFSYTAGGNHYPGAVTASNGNSAVKVGSYVGLATVTGGTGVCIAVKILPTQVI